VELNRSAMNRLILLIGLLITGHNATAGDMFASPSVSDIPALIACFDDSDVRLGASRALQKLGRPTTEQLSDALAADSLDVRIWAAYTLGQIGPDAASANENLVDCLRDDNADLRAVAVRALGQIQATDRGTISSLVTALSDMATRVRRRSAIALGKLGSDAQAAVPDLIETLNDQTIRSEVIDALVEIGQPTVIELIAALKNDNIRLDASEALRRIDPETARKETVDQPTLADLAALEIAIRDPARDVKSRIAAVNSLAQLGEISAPILLSVFADASTEVSRASSSAFRKIGASAVPLLRRTMKDDSPLVRWTTADAIGAIGPDARDAVPDLIAAIQDPDRTVRHRAVNALSALGPSAEPAVPALIAVMQNPRDAEPTRQLAIKVLGRTGPKVRDAVIAALEESTEDGNFGVSSLAKQLKADAIIPRMNH